MLSKQLDGGDFLCLGFLLGVIGLFVSLLTSMRLEHAITMEYVRQGYTQRVILIPGQMARTVWDRPAGLRFRNVQE